MTYTYENILQFVDKKNLIDIQLHEYVFILAFIYHIVVFGALYMLQ